MLEAESLEIRATEKGRMLSGYAARFNSRSHPIAGMFVEQIAPGAFSRTLSEGLNVRAYFNHDSSQVLGSTRGQTLRVSEDDKGLRFELDLPDTNLGRDIATLVARGDLYGMSFRFHTQIDEWQAPKSRDEYPLRTLKDVDLQEVSVATEPAYEAATCALRTAEQFRDGWKEELERTKRRLMLAERL